MRYILILALLLSSQMAWACDELELLSTLKIARSWIKSDNSLPSNLITLEYRQPLTPVEELRNQANRIEKKEIAIQEIDKVIDKCLTENERNS